jgi:P4 family phage/plasmid primase-like protien
MPFTPLDAFLNGFEGGKTEKDREGRKVLDKDKPFTLWSFENKQKWWVAEDDKETFYKLYLDDLENTVPRYLTERSTPIGQLRVDLDFKYEGRVDAHRHTREQVKSFAQAYMAEVKKYLNVPETVSIYILEKDYPTFDPTKGSPISEGKHTGLSSSGIHLQVPDIKTKASVEQAIRRSLLRRMEEFFPDLKFCKTWDDVYDKQPLSHTNNWPLLGSKKPDGLPYKIKYILDWEAETGEISVDTNIPRVSIDMIKKMSVRSTADEETEMTEYGKQNTHQAPEREVLTGVQRVVSAPRGRQAERTDQASRGSSPGRMIIPPLTQELRDYYAGHVNNLAAFRYNTYVEWVAVGQCLKNLHPDLNDLWHDFSSKYEDYKPSETENKWNSFGYRVDGTKLGRGSLRHWSREDNPEGFKQVEDTNVDSLMERSVETATENDVAQVIHAKYGDEFKCAKFGQNIWYRYCEHIWTETDKGVGLQIRLSKEISNLYHEKVIAKNLELRHLGDCGHSKAPELTCPTCQCEEKIKSYNNIRLKLKKTGFKESVMKECRELFLDEQLALKLDENKNLIAFENGVFDCSSLEFRDGKPDDYVSFSTKITFEPTKSHTTYECWAELDRFLRSILPNENVRRYFLKHLSTCLSGGNEAQKFHILTGSGSNGKSMLMNLMATAFGDYCCKAPISLLTQQRNKSAAAAPELVRMKGRRFVTMQEPDEQVPLNTGLMKELASCEKITARDLYAGSKQMIDFDIQARFHLACNDKPKVNSTDGGTWRRLVVIDFPMKFVPEPQGPRELPIDESIVQKVISEEWATCFMSYLIHLYREGNGWRKLTPPTEVMAYTNEYKVESDTVARFMVEFIQPLEENVIPESVNWNTITATFQEWKRSNEVVGRAAASDLKKKLEERFGKYPRNGWTSFRFGGV